MRVISGKAKGRPLFGPKTEAIRPVLDQVKEAIFNILFDVTDFTVLDLFAGTGAMGIEALSRGAKEAVFVDNLKDAVRLIGKNLDACGFADRATVLGMGADRAIRVLSRQGKKFDLIFVDPPYQKRFIKKTLRALAESPLLHPNTLVISEHHPKEMPGDIEGLSLTDSRKYGQTMVSFFRSTSL
ncbi:MAG: 16S rRNA (guanine(966)-N(2))-methyltransferase RsmD [Deltaproteobacteria bacterium]|nr:16S rRNA (guanine(966)-N(2))-methyltransferase RsmD [Deltaproteobacteria bacterium]